MMSLLKFVFIAVLLSSCSMFTPVQNNATRYMITAMPEPPKAARSSMTLLVNPIEASPVYNTTQMAYTVRSYQIAYYAKNKWAASPSQMLLPLMLQTLQNTHAFRAVISSYAVGRYDYVLSTQLLELRQIFFKNCSEVHLTLRAQMVNAANNQVMATKVFHVVERAPKNNPAGAAIAANRATAVLLAQLAQFCLR